MRKRTRFGLLVVLGALLVLLFTRENWLLAALVGMGLGATVFLFTHVYPHDIAPPADRRHENTQRRRSTQRETLR